jgi:DNA gyrase subunit A
MAEHIPVNIEDEMRTSYLDYAMSVIIGRAIPDVRDGLKPVHRRLLWGMHELRNTYNQPHKKSAKIVGEVMGNYHPHGDAALYDALVRMAQDFSMRDPLADGQGNFGSVDGDRPAAMRYTEVRMARLAELLLEDIEKDTVDWQPNYDESRQEPLVLPARFPNLLINGANGIAVGMATNIPPHNLSEVIDGTIALVRNPGLSVAELMEHITGPDFPTGGIIRGRSGIGQAYATGRGSITLRARADFETVGKREAIIVTELPYQVNKARLLEKIAELVREKKIEGIADLRDESDRDGMRIVMELKTGAVGQVVLNQLYRLTALQTTFGVINLSIVGGRPQTLNLKQTLEAFIAHRREVVLRRSRFDLRNAEQRAHILEGLLIAVDAIDEVIQVIRSSSSPAEARDALCQRFGLSADQAQAILDMRLSRLTGLERDKIREELAQLRELIARLQAILADEHRLLDVIVEELETARATFGSPRRTEIVAEEGDLSIADLIAEEDMVVTVSHRGYIKRTPLSVYRSQRRGGKGVTGMEIREEDVVAELFVASTHQPVLFLTTRGRAYIKTVFEIPAAGRASRGKALVNFIDVEADEKVAAVLPIPGFEEDHYLVTATKLGQVKKTDLMAYSNIRSSGLIAVNLQEDDELIGVRITNGQHEILLATREGMAIRFHEDQVRPMGRDTRGVKGIDLREGDQVVGMAVVEKGGPGSVLIVSEKGYGKLTGVDEYRSQNRGGKGLMTIRITEKNGPVVSLRLVNVEDHLIILTSGGKVIRIPVVGIRVTGRVAQGVCLVRLGDQEQVVGIERLEDPGDEAGETDSLPPPEPDSDVPSIEPEPEPFEVIDADSDEPPEREDPEPFDGPGLEEAERSPDEEPPAGDETPSDGDG